MEGGLPMLNCLLQQTLRSLCSFNSDSYSSRWVYAVFWRILPRNYPPPEWDHGDGSLERAKGNKRNWILVWEDGFCDFSECERAGNGYLDGRFGADVYFKMSHEVYNYGEGLIGKVAADNSHKWVFNDSPNVNDPSFTSSWNVSLDLQPRAWDLQFNTGIQTIAVISVREGLEYKSNGDNNASQNVRFDECGRPTEVRSCLKVEPSYAMDQMAAHQETTNFLNHNLQLTDVIAAESGFIGPTSASKVP
uniref:Transcription factor MYC/MYB N-terminal domain-containing protein n=1 Tax=Daucus carota subsp. sativus TaxID=79200 RepID=A0A165ZIE0_DAUCS